MVWAHRDQVLQLGRAPSKHNKAVKLHLQTAGKQFKDAIEGTNFVILQLKTKDNVSDAFVVPA